MSRISARARQGLAHPTALAAATIAAAMIGAAIVDAGPARAASPIGGSTNNVFATFTSDGMTTSLGPVNPVSASYPHSKSSSLAMYTGSVTLPPLVPGSPYPIVADLNVTTSKLTGSVTNTFGIDAEYAMATTSTKALNLSIVSTGPAIVDFLDVEAQAITGSADYTLIVPSSPSVSGAATITQLHVGGDLLNGASVTYSGSPPPNFTLISNSHVTVVLNEQTPLYVVSCNAGGTDCTVTPASITVYPVAIHLTGARIENGNVTGEIAIGTARAF